MLALQLTGHVRAVAADVRHRADYLPKNSALADVVLREAEGRLPVTIEGTCAASRTAPASSASRPPTSKRQDPVTCAEIRWQ